MLRMPTTSLTPTRLLGRAFGLSALGGLLVTAGLPTAAQQKPTGASLTVVVSGVHDRVGHLRVNLYRSADGFPADTSKAFQRRDVLLKSLDAKAPLDPIRVTFDGLAPGTYAVCSIHDSNGNDKLDANFLGIPREDWAVSNDARPKFRSPRFDEAGFTLAANGGTVVAFRVRH